MVPNNIFNAKADELVFSLDIGTRTVIGVVGTYIDNKFKIIASRIMEHQKRTMYDGQIHDINGVAEVVIKVKEALERELGTKLTNVAIAAAGRSLRTYRARIDREVDTTIEINKRMIESLEMEAIQYAQEAIDKSASKGDMRYYCVGYTVINYFLDDNFIENLELHRGNKIGVEVLATFLPHTVVDSLYTVMSKAGLEVINLTLEPIAAINVAIKQNLRLLNLALVDIGAGTSDIAITKSGTIVAYAMASIAGDEITEKIANTYLLDFDTAEKLKIELVSNNTHRFNDIVGIEHEITTEQILDNIDESIDNLAKEISDKVLEYNEKAPSAMFLVGGGSQIPRLDMYISRYLNIPRERIVVKNTDILDDILDIPKEISGPHAITPIGIAVTAANKKYKDFIEITVNGQKVSMFNSNSRKISDALVIVNYNPRKLIPKRGKGIKYNINGTVKEILGEVGEPAKIYLNGQLVNLEQILNDGDEIKIVEATIGADATIDLYNCIDTSKTITFNDKQIKLINNVRINGKLIEENSSIKENDYIEYNEINNLQELFEYLNLDLDKHVAYKDDDVIGKEYILESGDVITTICDTNEDRTCYEETTDKIINLIINGKVESISHNKEEFLFVDIFEYIDFDLSTVKGSLRLMVNGERTEYLRELNDGDKIEIYWEK